MIGFFDEFWRQMAQEIFPPHNSFQQYQQLIEPFQIHHYQLVNHYQVFLIRNLLSDFELLSAPYEAMMGDY
jgi:hypothetical protein